MTSRRKTELTLDATGWNRGAYYPDRKKLLNEGTPLDVRRALRELALLLDPSRSTGDDWALWLHASDRKWIADAFEKIGSGEDPKTALRLKSRRTSYKSLVELGEIEYQIDDLVRQGASKTTALTLVASYRLGFDRNGARPVPPTPAECNAEIERLKKMLGKKKREIIP